VVRPEVGGRDPEGHHGLVRPAAEARVSEHDRSSLDARPVRGAPLRAPRAAHLEDVGEVGAEANHHLDIAGAKQEIREDDLLDEAPVEDLTAADVEEVRGILEQLLVLGIAEHEVDLVVGRVRRLRAESGGPAVADVELVVREEARVLVEEAELPRPRRGHVPLACRDEEHGAASADEPLDLAGHRQDEEVVGRICALVHSLVLSPPILSPPILPPPARP
jgi:hypothetical protein